VALLLERVGHRGERGAEPEVDDRGDDEHAAQVAPGEQPAEALGELAPSISTRP